MPRIKCLMINGMPSKARNPTTGKMEQEKRERMRAAAMCTENNEKVSSGHDTALNLSIHDSCACMHKTGPLSILS